jgi:hypothetical protein
MLDIDLRQGWEEERMGDEFIVGGLQIYEYGSKQDYLWPQFTRPGKGILSGWRSWVDSEVMLVGQITSRSNMRDETTVSQGLSEFVRRSMLSR